MKTIYLDYAAATPVDLAAIRVAEPFISDRFHNPSAVYQASRNVRSEIESSRGQVANILGAKSKEIIFTAGGTEANNIAIYGILAQDPSSHCVISAIEHESVLEPASKFAHTIVPTKGDGIVSAQAVIDAVKPETRLISIMYANNEIGTIQPIKDIVTEVANIRRYRMQEGNKTPLYVHTDACQAANYLDIQVQRIGVDLMTLNGGKIYSYKQSGCLYVKTSVSLQSYMHGGGQERSIRSGTENPASIMAFATMLQKVQKRRKSEVLRLKQIQTKFIANLSQIPKLSINGSTTKRLPNNINITIAGCDGERLLMELDEAGVMVATGSACTASSDEPSHVLLAIGKTKAEASSSLRLTMGAHTTAKDMSEVFSRLVTVIKNHTRLV